MVFLDRPPAPFIIFSVGKLKSTRPAPARRFCLGSRVYHFDVEITCFFVRDIADAAVMDGLVIAGCFTKAVEIDLYSRV